MSSDSDNGDVFDDEPLFDYWPHDAPQAEVRAPVQDGDQRAEPDAGVVAEAQAQAQEWARTRARVAGLATFVLALAGVAAIAYALLVVVLMASDLKRQQPELNGYAAVALSVGYLGSMAWICAVKTAFRICKWIVTAVVGLAAA